MTDDDPTDADPTDDRASSSRPGSDAGDAGLASAYLDDELRADERARLEADEGLMVQVARLRGVRALLGDVEPAAISVREQHLATALDAWDRLPAGERSGDATPHSIGRNGADVDGAGAAAAASIATPSTRRARARRPVSTVWMGVAAAAMLVVAGGAVVWQSMDDDDATEISFDDDAAGESAAEGADAAAADEAVEDSDAARDATAALGELAGGDPAEAAEIIAEAIPEGGLDTGIDTPAPPIDVPLEELSDTDQLAIFAADAVGAPVASQAPTAASPDSEDSSELAADVLPLELRTCGSVDLLVGPASYRGREVVVGIDLGRDLAFAHDLVTCTEVARVRLP